MLKLLVIGVFLTTAGLTLFLFRFLDQLVSEVKVRSRLLRIAFALFNGTAVAIAISFYRGMIPTASLVLFMDICLMLEYLTMSKDGLLEYLFMGSAVFFNHLMIYVLVYSVYRFVAIGGLTHGLYQRAVFTIANLVSTGVIVLFRVPVFPTEGVRRIIHSGERLLLNIWFPVISGITFLNTTIILPVFEEVWNQQSTTWLEQSREIAFYVIIAQWALFMMSSSYLVVFYQAGRLGIQDKFQDAKEQADRQPLTGLYNRRAWDREVRLALDAGKKGYLVMLDLDHFKDVNDNLGHPEGDRILKETADMLRQTFRKLDLIGHIGGDEFCVFLVGDLEKETVNQRLEYLMNLRRKEFQKKDGGTFWVSLSVGYAAVSDLEETDDRFAALVFYADTALYWQKEHGRNGYTMWSEELIQDDFQGKGKGNPEN